jgi:hypothetical protein
MAKKGQVQNMAELKCAKFINWFEKGGHNRRRLIAAVGPLGPWESLAFRIVTRDGFKWRRYDGELGEGDEFFLYCITSSTIPLLCYTEWAHEQYAISKKMYDRFSRLYGQPWREPAGIGRAGHVVWLV